MKVIAYGIEYECAYAEKTKDTIRLYDEQGNEVGTFSGISDFSDYTVQDGEWTEYEEAPTAEERIAELEAINAELEDALCEMDADKQAEIDELHDTVAALEDAVCEMDVANAERIAAIEDALCEMDMG